MKHPPETIDKAVEVFKEGGIVVFPTDTVWGISVAIDQPQAIERLYQIKGREKNKPTAVLVGSVSQAERLGKINKTAEKLIRKYWPGSLTIVVKAQEGVPEEIQGKGGTIGLRMPDEELVLKLAQKLNRGLVTASANFAGQPAPTSKALLDSRLLERVDLVLPGEASGQPSSTVVDVTGKSVKVLRKGSVKVNIDIFKAFPM